MTETSTRSDFLDLFSTSSEAVAFETAALSIGDDFLPAAAIAVRDGATEEPPAEYWAWLCEQAEGGAS